MLAVGVFDQHRGLGSPGVDRRIGRQRCAARPPFDGHPPRRRVDGTSARRRVPALPMRRSHLPAGDRRPATPASAPGGNPGQHRNPARVECLQPATLPDGTPVDPEVARTLAEDATWRAILTEMLTLAQQHRPDLPVPAGASAAARNTTPDPMPPANTAHCEPVTPAAEPTALAESQPSADAAHCEPVARQPTPGGEPDSTVTDAAAQAVQVVPGAEDAVGDMPEPAARDADATVVPGEPGPAAPAAANEPAPRTRTRRRLGRTRRRRERTRPRGRASACSVQERSRGYTPVGPVPVVRDWREEFAAQFGECAVEYDDDVAAVPPGNWPDENSPEPGPPSTPEELQGRTPVSPVARTGCGRGPRTRGVRRRGLGRTRHRNTRRSRHGSTTPPARTRSRCWPTPARATTRSTGHRSCVPVISG